jgi:pre-mRNA-splicing factor ATP-dependent RNA helicase DHX16
LARYIIPIKATAPAPFLYNLHASLYTMPPSTTQDLSELRLRSRQQYLEKRETEQLALLKAQVDEEQEELRANPNLSEKERAEFARNRTTLRLAQERLNISDHLDGYNLPGADSVEDKTSVLNKRHRNDKYVSEFQQFEIEQTRAAQGWLGKSSEQVREDDYELVFDQAFNFDWDSDALRRIDPEKQQLEQRLDAAEQKAKSIEDVRKSLPVYQYRDQLLAAIEEHPVIVLIGETGSGKTTQVPQFLASLNHGKKIMITQPRRVAAMSVAARVAEEQSVKLGTTVGYRVRFDEKISPSTTIEYVTDGLALQLILNDPSLSEYSYLIIDEAHELTQSTDILLTIAKDLVKHRSDFKVIISSATVNAQKFSDYFNACPIFSIPGRLFDVQTFFSAQPEANYLSAAASVVFQIHISQDLPGDILVFLTGEEEIVSLAESLANTAKKLGSKVPEMIIRPLYASLPASEQQKVFEPTPVKARKVVLATNIAETSITIDGCKYVVDSGYSKENFYEPKTGMESLVVTPISRASAQQRAGRAGRVGPGKCFRYEHLSP